MKEMGNMVSDTDLVAILAAILLSSRPGTWDDIQRRQARLNRAVFTARLLLTTARTIP